MIEYDTEAKFLGPLPTQSRPAPTFTGVPSNIWQEIIAHPGAHVGSQPLHQALWAIPPSD